MIEATQTTATTTATRPGETGTKPVLSSDFETFLKMLTVQMQNQDPLNPADATEFATQLATFSALEQQVRSNSLLATIRDRLGTDANAAVGLLGRDIAAPGPARFAGSPIELALDSPEAAETVSLLVRDDSGTLLQRLDVAPGARTLVWAGVDEDGTAFPAGTYAFSAEAFDSGGNALESRVAAFARVTELRGGTEPMLVLSDNRIVDPDDLIAARLPAPDT